MEHPRPTIPRKYLFKCAMGGQWLEVVALYSADDAEEIQSGKITRAGDTALHLAVADGQEEIVDQLVSRLKDPPKALSVQNNQGNTPLHLAASMGSVPMCFYIADQRAGDLVAKRNNDGETPYFLAALNGKKDAFLCLHFLLGETDEDRMNNGLKYARRSDGDTILHCAIAGEHFGIFVENLEIAPLPNHQSLVDKRILLEKKKKLICPRNYEMFVQFSELLWKMIKFTGKFIKHSSRKSEGQRDSKNQIESSTRTNFDLLLPKTIKLCSECSSRSCRCTDDENLQKEQDNLHQVDESNKDNGRKKYGEPFPPNYKIFSEFIKIIYKFMLVVLGLGWGEILKIKAKREKHTWSIQILEELLHHSSGYEYNDTGGEPGEPILPSATSLNEGRTNPYEFIKTLENESAETSQMKDGENENADKGKTESVLGMEKNIALAQNDASSDVMEKMQDMFPVAIHDINDPNKSMVLSVQEKKIQDMSKKETPILIAAKNGIREIVERILNQSPVAIHDTNADKKNIVHLVVEHRQPLVYDFLLNKKPLKQTIFSQQDKEGNSALHLAAVLRDHQPWNIPGAALQMQLEMKWYQYVKESMPLHFFSRHNNRGNTPKDIFGESHKDLVQKGGEWLNKTSKSCSVVAALIATVAFATSATVPGGNSKNGKPRFEHQPAFNVFAVSSLIALCCSVTAVIMFLSILTSRHQEKDFGRGLPTKLLLGMTSLLISIGAMLVSFCAGHFFVLRDELKYAAFPVYGVTCLPVTFFAIAQFSLYFDLLWAVINAVPQRSYKTTL
ncbi:uncharacterized protein LOC131155503 isoform X2 [Malania oleifera]|uniref:uncharacterized protein LOC131155503 isoform X2 n=1 Tax=Malania oleifera TaxID=397392 RepID=UPI0025AEB124|nr:uncharacterized protein LOC131155503 isoform X2 [Malania oleifera]